MPRQHLVLVAVEERAVALGWEHSGPSIGRVAELLRVYDEQERAAIRGCPEGVREATGAED
ncbi:hypothetical protein [Streptomyces sp. NPDC005799]|uniref:hypothetical protein n=1 Tax=Streptomyces sp. NPDC005799 TaxID=3154678 RepID=UPI00340F9815